MGPWARAFLARCLTPEGSDTASSPVEDLRVEASLITGRVGEETVTLAAEPIPAGVWAAIEPVPSTQSESFAHGLEHTWEQPLVPEEVVRVGSVAAVAAVAEAVAAEIDRDPSVLLRWRGHGAGAADGDPWRGRELPPLPPPARRPPDSVPNRLGTSGIRVGGGDLAEAAARMYRSFEN
jgi:hypothetical protein